MSCVNLVVCDTAKVRFFKQITTCMERPKVRNLLFAILQKYDFSSKSQRICISDWDKKGCLRYCKSTIFQANHNCVENIQAIYPLFAILQKYDFSSKSQLKNLIHLIQGCCLRYCKSTIFQANHNSPMTTPIRSKLFAILQKYDFSSKSQLM